MTSSDVLHINNSEELIGLIDEVASVYPEWMYFPASPIGKTSYKTLVRTALPETGFRSENAGIENKKSTLTSRSVDCKFFDASWLLDVMLARQCEWGSDFACAQEAQAHLESAISNVAKQTWYGTDANAAGFAGVASLFPYADSERTVNAGGSTAGTGSSVFAVRFGTSEACYAWGNNAGLVEGDIETIKVKDADGKFYYAHAQEIDGWVGLQITSHKSFGRICNLTKDSGKGLTDDLVAELLATFPAGKEPHALFMTKRSRLQLQKSRTATNATGAPAPIPTESHGVPILVTDAISNTETLLADEGA